MQNSSMVMEQKRTLMMQLTAITFHSTKCFYLTIATLVFNIILNYSLHCLSTVDHEMMGWWVPSEKI